MPRAINSSKKNRLSAETKLILVTAIILLISLGLINLITYFDGTRAISRQVIILSILVFFISVLLTGIFAKLILASLKPYSGARILEKETLNDIKSGCSSARAAVLSLDIHGFSSVLKILKNKFGSRANRRISELLNKYYEHISDRVEKTNGAVEYFSGNSFLAHWGIARAAGQRKDAMNCIKSALLARDVLVLLRRECKTWKVFRPAIRIGCGISYGVVISGFVAGKNKMAHTVLGDHVNMACRLKALTKPMGADILICEDTWRLVGDYFITKEMPSVKVRGKKTPMRVFAVINSSKASKGPRTLSEVREFIGAN